MLVQRQVGNERLEFLVLFFELFEALQFSDTQTSELSLSAVEGLLGDAERNILTLRQTSAAAVPPSACLSV